ncbi:MAG: NACHT domain-containing protein, partial [Leptolyngbya sp. DLM2.Bin15]
MFLGTPTPEFLQTTTEAIARFIQWVAELIRRRNWFMLLVLTGVALAALGGFFRDQINERFLAEAAQGAVWASFWTGVVLIFISALVVAVVTMPRPGQEPEDDSPERKAIKGLRPFSRDDAEIFTQLQRTSSLRECCETVTSQSYKFGILMGESGCGKTSFLQAGLWPKLSLPDSSHGAVYVRFSDQEPLETIRQAVADQLEVPVEWLTGTAVEPSHGAAFIHVLTQARQAADQPIVLLFDQFEQVFVHNPRKDDRAPFVQAMTAWYKTSALDTVKVLVSIRADLLHELYELQEALGYSLGPQDLFKLERFTPEEASRILGVIAETERLDFDARFVQELAERELAHRESGTISPVDLQILAWMIERQQGDDVRAFNRMAFQKFGGVEGLLSRFLDRTLDARALPQQRDAAVKTLLALTDLERQVRSGVLTVAELQDMLKAT